MQSQGSEFLEKFEEAKVELARLSQTIYAPRDVASILASLGTRIELFLKSVVLPSESPWRPFKYFINCLDDVLDSEEIVQLHSFRELCNFSRHNPRLGIGVVELRSVIDSVEPIINKLISLEIGRTSELVSVSVKRMYWIVAWEHFNDAEVHIIVPSSEDVGLGPPELDLVHLELEYWDHAKQLLSTTGQVSGAKGNVPSELLEIWGNSRGFVEAICFEGEYRELLTSLARFESPAKQIAGANRTDCSQCVLVACLVAFVDVFSSIDTPNDVIEQITKQIISSYAMTSSAADLEEITKELAEVSQTLWERGDTTRLIGPLWASNEEYKNLRKNAIIESDDYLFIVDQQYCLIALHS